MEMSTPLHTTFEIRTPRTSELTPEAAAHFFATLPNPPTGILNWFAKAPSITVEFLSQGQTVFTLLTVPTDHEEYFVTQLSAAYPQVRIKKLEHNPLDAFSLTAPIEVGRLRLSSGTYLPIKTYKETAPNDPLTNIFSTLAKLGENEQAMIQFEIHKATEHWKHGGHKAAEGHISNGVAVPHPQKAQIETKLAQSSFGVCISIVAQAQTQERSNQILRSLQSACTSVDLPYQSLRLTQPLLRKTRFAEQILHRAVPYSHQYLSNDELATLVHLPNKNFSAINNIAWGKTLQGEPPENLPTYGSLSEEERANVNLFGRVQFKNQDQIFGIKREDRRRHMYVLGKSGTGKSTLLANMIISDLKHNEGIAVIDPHGDLIETVLDYIPKHRINDVILLDPADPEAVVKMNLFEGGSMVHRELIASGIVSIFQKMYAHSWGPRLEYILRNTLLTLLSEQAKLDDILHMLTDDKFRAKVVDRLQDPVLKNFWVTEFNTMTEKQRIEAISPILNKVGQFVTSPLVSGVVNAKTSSFNIEEVMDQGKILLVNVSQGKLGEDNASLLGAMMITKIQLAAMNRVYKSEESRRDFYLYIDEFQNFATTSFVKILSEARKYRLNLTLANQYMDQIPEEVKAAIFGNAGTICSFILGASDADAMMKEFGQKYTQEDLVSLERYQIITKLMIDNQMSQPFPAATLSLSNSKNQNKDKVLRSSRERYARKK